MLNAIPLDPDPKLLVLREFGEGVAALEADKGRMKTPRISPGFS
jgi:hypothetical protein